jgi:hypothetical protein
VHQDGGEPSFFLSFFLRGSREGKMKRERKGEEEER